MPPVDPSRRPPARRPSSRRVRLARIALVVAGGALALAEQRQSQVRQRRQVTGGADRALGRDPGHEAGVQDGEQRVEGGGLDRAHALPGRVQASAAGQAGGGAPALMDVSYSGDTNLADPIVAPFVTKTAQTLTVSTPVDGLPATMTTTPVSDQDLWGNVYGAAHGGDCAAS